MKFLLKRKIPAGLSTETIFAAPGAVKCTQFYTLSFNEGWFPNGDPQVMAASVVRLPIWIRSLKTITQEP
jgi:hypothetical protein